MVFSKTLFALRNIAVDNSSNSVDVLYYYLFNVQILSDGHLWDALPFITPTSTSNCTKWTNMHIVQCVREQGRQNIETVITIDRSHWPKIQDSIDLFLSKIMHTIGENEHFKPCMGCSIFKWIFSCFFEHVWYGCLSVWVCADGEMLMMIVWSAESAFLCGPMVFTQLCINFKRFRNIFIKWELNWL